MVVSCGIYASELSEVFLSTADVEALIARAKTSNLGNFRSISPSGITLGALMELVCAWWTWARDGQKAGASVVEAWSAYLPDLREANGLLNDERPRCAAELFGAPRKELWALRRAEDLWGDEALLFQERFRRSLKVNGFGGRLSLAISKAMQEMADNVLQHSGRDEYRPAPGLLGYQVEQQWMSYAVADVGRGVLSSLKTNPKWSSLSSSKDALTAAVLNDATRRADAPNGNGFDQVKRSLIDLGGRLRFRTGSAWLSLAENGRDARRITVGSCERIVGFQLVVSCSLKGAVGDRIL
jgi:hypothetical protein